MISFMTFMPAFINLGIILVGALVAYYVVVQKMDDNLKLRDIVFRVISSILLGSVLYTIISQFISPMLVTTRVFANPVYTQLYQIFSVVLYLGIGALVYGCSRDISIHFHCSDKQYQVIKVISAFMLGWIAKDVVMLLLNIMNLTRMTIFE